MKIELFYFEGCPNYEVFLPHLRDLLQRAGVVDDIHLIRVDSPEEADRQHFLGSPTLRIDGSDVEPGAGERTDFGMKCRLYRIDDGVSGMPHDQSVLQALRASRTAG